MKPNINDLTRLQDLKSVLAEKNVTAPAIATLEKALKRGMAFKALEDMAILNIPTADMAVLGEAVSFGTTIVVVPNIKTVEYRFQPVGDAAFFFGYQFVVEFRNTDGFTIQQSYPIDGLNTVIVDFDRNEQGLSRCPR